MKSTYMMINDRSCCGKELEIDFFTQEPSAHNKISTFCQNKSTTYSSNSSTMSFCPFGKYKSRA